MRGVPDLGAFYPEKYAVMLGKSKPQKFNLFFLYILTSKFSLYILLQTRSCITYPGIHLPPQLSLTYSVFQNQRPWKVTIFSESLTEIWSPNTFFILISPSSYYLFLCQLAWGMSHSLLWLARRQGGICWSSQLPGELQVQWCLHWHPAAAAKEELSPSQWAAGGCPQAGAVTLLASWNAHDSFSALAIRSLNRKPKGRISKSAWPSPNANHIQSKENSCWVPTELGWAIKMGI